MRPFLPMLVAFAAILATTFAAPAEAAQGCGNVRYASERAKLERVLISRGYPKSERSFLLRGADRHVRELTRGALNEQGRQCGIDAVRAHILGCVAASVQRAPSSDRKTGAAMWGKSNVTGREAVFIGMFHACRGTAMKALSTITP